LNCNVFFIGKFASKKVVLEDLYEEVSNVLTIEQFEELYDKATEDQYGSLIIDCSHKEKRFLKGLDTQSILKLKYLIIVGIK
jgi:Trk K+ transport system NAD-binding subunit